MTLCLTAPFVADELTKLRVACLGGRIICLWCHLRGQVPAEAANRRIVKQRCGLELGAQVAAERRNELDGRQRVQASAHEGRIFRDGRAEDFLDGLTHAEVYRNNLLSARVCWLYLLFQMLFFALCRKRFAWLTNGPRLSLALKRNNRDSLE